MLQYLLWSKQLLDGAMSQLSIWIRIFSYNASEISYNKNGEVIKLEGGVCSRAQLVLRCTFALIANVFFAFVVFFAVPLVLATAENDMEFVLNAFAANYIVDLDDLSDGAEITLAAAGYAELGGTVHI